MAKLTEEKVTAALREHLQPGEELRQWAVGVRQPSIWIIVPLLALAVLPGVIAVQVLTKSYILGLTDRRLIVLEVASITNAKLKAVSEYELASFADAPAATRTGGLFTHIRIDREDQPFRAKFHRAFAKGHRERAMEIARALGAPG